MRIIICGAGQVGSSIARQLSREDNEITIIDYNADLIRQVSEQLDVKTLHGHASHPSTLKAARAADADMLIAVTYSDEVNMVACQIGYSLFDIPIRIARIRHQDYLNPEWSHLYAKDQMALNVVISPEVEVADAILRRLHAPGSLDSIPFAEDSVRVVAVRCMSDCPVLGLPIALIKERAPDIAFHLLGVLHRNVFSLPSDKTMLHEQDEVYFIAPTKEVRRVMSLFGHSEREARRAVILGGGNIGLLLAQKLEQDDAHAIRTKLIEYSPQRAQIIAEQLRSTTVVCGSALSQEILQEVGIDLCETVIAVTNDDETNILGTLLSKQFGAQRTTALVNNASYIPLLSELGVDVIINPREITVSRILEQVRRGKIESIHAIADGAAEIIEAQVIATSAILGKSIQELNLPAGVLFGAILRAGTMIVPTPETVIMEKDHIIILALAKMVRKVERIFSAGMEYF